MKPVNLDAPYRERLGSHATDFIREPNTPLLAIEYGPKLMMYVIGRANNADSAAKWLLGDVSMDERDTLFNYWQNATSDLYDGLVAIIR